MVAVPRRPGDFPAVLDAVRRMVDESHDLERQAADAIARAKQIRSDSQQRVERFAAYRARLKAAPCDRV